MPLCVSPPLQGVEILFLDFDGVIHPLHCHESKHFCHLHLFEEILKKVPHLEVVVSSTWRTQRSLSALRALFPKTLSDRIVGMTPLYSALDDIPDSLVNYQREAECQAWLQQNGKLAKRWVALDDSSWNFRPFNKNVFLVDSANGLDALTAEHFLSYLMTSGSIHKQ